MKLRIAVPLMLAGCLSSGIALADHHGGADMHSEMHGDRVPPMFSQFDKNNDGRVSRD